MEPKALTGVDVVVYSAPWCSDCRRLDRWLSEQGLSLAKVDIEADPGAAERLERETGKRAIPFLLVNGRRWVPGYHKDLPSRFDADRLVREVLEAARA